MTQIQAVTPSSELMLSFAHASSTEIISILKCMSPASSYGQEARLFNFFFDKWVELFNVTCGMSCGSRVRTQTLWLQILWQKVESKQMKKAKAIIIHFFFLWTWHSKRVGQHHLCFDRDSRAGRGVGNLYRGKRGSFRCALVGCCWHEEAVGRITRRRTS